MKKFCFVLFLLLSNLPLAHAQLSRETEAFFAQLVREDEIASNEDLSRPLMAFAGGKAQGFFSILEVPMPAIQKWVRENGHGAIKIPKEFSSTEHFPVLVALLYQRDSRRLQVEDWSVDTVAPGIQKIGAKVFASLFGEGALKEIVKVQRLDFHEAVVFAPFDFIEGDHTYPVTIPLNGYTESANAAYAKPIAEFGKILEITDADDRVATDGRTHFMMEFSRRSGIHSLFSARAAGTPDFHAPEFKNTERAMKMFLGRQPLLTFRPDGTPAFMGFVHNLESQREFNFEPTTIDLSVGDSAILNLPRTQKLTFGYRSEFSWVFLGPYESMNEILEDSLFRNHATFGEVKNKIVAHRLGLATNVTESHRRGSREVTCPANLKP